MSKGQKKYPVQLHLKITKEQAEHLKAVYGDGGASQFIRFWIEADMLKTYIQNSHIKTPTIMKGILQRDMKRFNGSVPPFLLELYSYVSGMSVEDMRFLCREVGQMYSG